MGVVCLNVLFEYNMKIIMGLIYFDMHVNLCLEDSLIPYINVIKLIN